MATAFVAGATGYTGREVVTQLVTRGVRTIAHVRPDSPRLAEWRTRFTTAGAEVDATPWQEDAMTATLTRLAPGLVFALLGTTRARGDSYQAVDYGLTALLMRAAQAVAPPRPRLVYLSSAGVGPRARGDYLQTRWRVEQALRGSGLPFTIARPSFITGAGRDDRRPLERTLAGAADGMLFVAGMFGGRGLRARYRSTTSAALAAALVGLALDPAAENRVIESESLRG